LHKSHGTCEECQICGKKDATTVCTFIIDESGKKETDCWCVCEECKDKLKEGVHDYYREMIRERANKRRDEVTSK